MRLGLLALAIAATFAGCTCDKPKSDAAVDAAPPASAALTVADASSINACTYLTPADLEKTTGLLAPGNRKSSSPTNATCTWGSFDKKMVVLEIFATSAQYDQSRRSFETLYKSKAEEVDGIGKRAFYLEGVASLAAATLVAEKPAGGAFLVQISGKEFTLTKAKDEVLAVARIVAAK